MAEYLIQDTSLIAVADAIREKTGGTEGLTLDQMVLEIQGITGGSGEIYAAIGVEYDEGWFCGVADSTGSTILATAGDTSGTWIFPIAEAGTYIVVAAPTYNINDPDLKSKTIVITEEERIATANLASLSLKSAGYTFTKSTGGDKGAYVTIQSGWLKFHTEWTPNYTDYAWGVSDQRVDVTDYTKLTVTFKVTGATTSMTQAFVRFGVNAKNTGNISSSSYYQSNTKITTDNGTFTKEIDISAKTGEMYVYGGVYDNNGGYYVEFLDFVFS